jgi:flavodoxin
MKKKTPNKSKSSNAKSRSKPNSKEPAQKKHQSAGSKKVLVVFYSRTGNTRKVAEALASHIKADSEEIFDTKDRSGIAGYLHGGRDAVKKELTVIKDITKKPGKYDLVIIGTPVWAGRMAPAIRTYICGHKKDFNEVAFFCTLGGSGAQKTFSEMALVTEKTPEGQMEFYTKEVVQGAFVDKLKGLAKLVVTGKE